MASTKLPKELHRDLAKLFEREIQRAAAKDSVQGKDCVRLVELLPSSHGCWTPAQARHVRTCGRCQRLVALAWRNECPDVAQIVRNAGPKPAPALAGAFQIHLREDSCPRCVAIESWALELKLVSGNGAGALRALRPAVVQYAGREPGKTALDQSTSADRSFSVLIQTQKAETRVSLKAESRAASDGGRLIEVQFRSGSERKNFRLPLEWDGRTCRVSQLLRLSPELAWRSGSVAICWLAPVPDRT